MNIQIEAFRYLDYILQKNTGFKALLFDQETLKFISVAMTITELYQNEVYFIEELPSLVRRPKVPEVESFSCICILRPTSENINLICAELEKPHFPKYNLYFTSSISDEQIRELGNHDFQALINDLQEVYLDFSALGTRLFSLNINDIVNFRNNPTYINYSSRIVEGLFAAICSLQLKPIIRYDCNSDVSKEVASKLSELVQTNSDLFGRINIDSALVLILDRRNDPVTPLLHIFNYYSTIHDLFTIDNNVVKVAGKEYPIDERNDPNAEKLGTLFLEDAGNEISNQFDNVSKTYKDINNAKIGTMNDKMIKCLQGSTMKTYAENNRKLYKALHKKCLDDNLLVITALEQVIVSSNDADYQYQQIEKLITSNQCNQENALRLALIFSMHYEKSNNEIVLRLLNLLHDKFQWSGKEMQYANALYNIAGYGKRIDRIFPSKSSDYISRLKNAVGLGDKSQFEKYYPPLEAIIKNIKDKKLDVKKYPFAGSDNRRQPQKVIIFYVGGATYLEHVIATDNSSKNSYQFIIGGTCIHNAKTFLKYEVDPFC